MEDLLKMSIFANLGSVPWSPSCFCTTKRFCYKQRLFVMTRDEQTENFIPVVRNGARCVGGDGPAKRLHYCRTY